MLLVAAGLSAGCAGEYSPASYPSQLTQPPPDVQPVNLRLGVILNTTGWHDGAWQKIINGMRATGLFSDVEYVASAFSPNFDLFVDLRGMDLSDNRRATLLAARTKKSLMQWRPSCGWNDPLCINSGKIARDIAWALAKGTPLQAQLAVEMKPVDYNAEPAESPAPEPAASAAPSGDAKPWWSK